MIICHFDGSYDPITGTATYGAIIKRDRRSLVRLRGRDQGLFSCNVSEYLGFIAVLRYLLDQDLHREPIRVIGDSQLVIFQMFGRMRIKRGRYAPFAQEAKSLLTKFPAISGEWIPRHLNAKADSLTRDLPAVPSRHLWRRRQHLRRRQLADTPVSRIPLVRSKLHERS